MSDKPKITRETDPHLFCPISWGHGHHWNNIGTKNEWRCPGTPNQAGRTEDK